MLHNYLRIAWRNLTRDATYTIINLSGLAIGFLCCILIALYIHDELSYDSFHEKGDRIVLIGPGDPDDPSSRGMSTSYPLGDALVSDLSFVQKTVRVFRGSGEASKDGRAFREVKGTFHVGESFFEVFDFPLLRGNPVTVLARPNTAVVSRAFAEEYFGDEDPVGQTLHVRRNGEHTYEITGVAESRRTSYLDFNILLSFATTDFEARLGDTGGSVCFRRLPSLRNRQRPLISTRPCPIWCGSTTERILRRSILQLPFQASTCRTW